MTQRRNKTGQARSWGLLLAVLYLTSFLVLPLAHQHLPPAAADAGPAICESCDGTPHLPSTVDNDCAICTWARGNRAAELAPRAVAGATRSVALQRLPDGPAPYHAPAYPQQYRGPPAA